MSVMSSVPRCPYRSALVLVAVAVGAAAISLAAGPEQTPPPAAAPELASFLAENDAAMKTMMADMAIKPSGDVDRDFVAMMIPHHQGAIDMARAELRYGRNEPLRRLAHEIIVSQLQEIEAMRLAVAQPPAAAVSSPPADTPMHHSHMPAGSR